MLSRLLRQRHTLGPGQTLGHLGLPSHPRTLERGTHLPELQALLHDRVGREEDQEPVGDHAGDVACKHGLGQGRAPAGAPWPPQGTGQGSAEPGRRPGLNGTALTQRFPQGGQTLVREPAGKQEAAARRVPHAARPPCPPGPYRLSKAELSWAPSGPLGMTPTQIWCLSMTCGFSRKTGKGLGQAEAGPVRS